jgi:predicted RNA-binding Zn ribbon-like protein
MKETTRAKHLSPTPAPGRLQRVQDFVNTLDLRAERDHLRTPEALTLWLFQRGLLSSITPLDETAWKNALEVREGLRAVLRAHGGQPLDEETLERLNSALDDTHLCVRFGTDGTVWLESVESGWKGALAHFVDVVFEEMGAGRWERLKACANEECQRAFYDATAGRDGKWCGADGCGRPSGARTSPCRDSRARRLRAHAAARLESARE